MDQVLMQASRLPHVIQIPRSSTALAYFNDTLFSFGGFSQLYHSDLNSADLTSSVGHWLPRERQPVAPSVRRGHTLTQLSNTKFVLFGGDSQGKCMNDLWLYTGVWEKVEPATEDVPIGRYGHSAVLLGDYLYIFGGKNPEEQVLFEDLWRFNFSNTEWEQIIEVGPESRYGCSLTAMSATTALLFGGSCSTGRLNDIWSLSVDGKWSELIENEQLEIEPRTEHGACSLNEGFLCVFGGYSQERPLGDCWVIDVASRRSHQLDTGATEFFSPRHAFGYVQKTEFLGLGEASTFETVFGGSVLSLNTIDSKPIYSANQTTIYVFAGAGEGGHKLGDLYKIELCCLARSSDGEAADFLKSLENKSLMQAKIDQLKAQADNGPSNMASIEELSGALEDFQEAAVGAFTHLAKNIGDVQTSEQSVVQRQNALESRFEQLDKDLDTFLKDAKIAEMKCTIMQLEQDKRLLFDKISRLERVIFSSSALDPKSKQEWIQGESLRQDPHAAEQDEQSQQNTIEQSLKDVDTEAIKNSVVRINTDEFDQIEHIIKQCNTVKAKYENEAKDAEALNLDDIDSQIMQFGYEEQ